MDFAISGVHVSPIYLALVGFVVGILGGFFGVGGSFLAGPALVCRRRADEHRRRHRPGAHRGQVHRRG